jgi:hypothetical protein
MNSGNIKLDQHRAPGGGGRKVSDLLTALGA